MRETYTQQGSPKGLPPNAIRSPDRVGSAPDGARPGRTATGKLVHRAANAIQ